MGVQTKFITVYVAEFNLFGKRSLLGLAFVFHVICLLVISVIS